MLLAPRYSLRSQHSVVGAMPCHCTDVGFRFCSLKCFRALLKVWNIRPGSPSKAGWCDFEALEVNSLYINWSVSSTNTPKRPNEDVFTARFIGRLPYLRSLHSGCPMPLCLCQFADGGAYCPYVASVKSGSIGVLGTEASTSALDTEPRRSRSSQPIGIPIGNLQTSRSRTVSHWATTLQMFEWGQS